MRPSASRLLLVLDDLHWADEPSLLCCTFWPSEMAWRIVVVAIYRDVELGRHHPLSATLAELARGRSRRGSALRGLARETSTATLEITAGHVPGAGGSRRGLP